MKRFFTFVVVTLLCLSASAKQGKAVVDGIEWTYEVIDEDAKTCMVGAGDINSKNPPAPAIDQTITGSVTVPEYIDGYKVIKINDDALKNCQVSLIVVPNTVSTIGDDAFKSENLIKLELGSGITYVGEDALERCENLADVIILTTTPPSVKNQLFPISSHKDDYPSKAVLHVPAGCKAAYSAADGWKDFLQCGGIVEDAATSINSAKNVVGTSEVERYTLEGRRTNGEKGINFIRMSDGTTKKIFVK